MDGAHCLARPTLPQTIDNPKTKKQKLHNDVITFLSAKGLKWHGDEVLSVGTAFVRAIIDSLWAIDGHHSVFASRSVPISTIYWV